jgi:hypothetical protein
MEAISERLRDIFVITAIPRYITLLYGKDT